MGATTSFDTVVWSFIGVFALICAVWLARAVWRLVVGAADVGGEVASIVYETGSSDTHFLLKVIITILFPPLLFLWIWKGFSKGFREASQEAKVVIADQEVL